MQEDGVSNVTIYPDQPLLLRCRITTYEDPYPEWDHDGVKLNAANLACRPYSQEVFAKCNTDHGMNYSHYNPVFFNSSALKSTSIVKVG